MIDKAELAQNIAIIPFLREHQPKYKALLTLLMGELDELEEAAREELEAHQEEKKRQIRAGGEVYEEPAGGPGGVNPDETLGGEGSPIRTAPPPKNNKDGNPQPAVPLTSERKRV